MATWVTHLMIADIVLEKCPSLDRRGFCVGSVAPDCNIENADWTEFTPPREVTHWMVSKKKTFDDCERFLTEYFLPRAETASSEEYSFLLGYWAHLIADAEFQRYIRDEDRVRASWLRIKADPELAARAEGLEETWDSVKLLIPNPGRMQQIFTIEAEYLETHPSSGYLTELMPLTDFSDYIDYLPPGGIIRKIRNMRVPEKSKEPVSFIAMTREEYDFFVSSSASIILDILSRKNLIP